MTEKRNYRYPLKNIDKSDDYLKIEALKYKPPGLNEDLNSFALGSSDDTYRNIGTSDIRGSVILPIPESIADVDFVINAPQYSIFGIALYACSYVLAILSTDTSQLGQYKTRIDSGNPTDNPIENSSKFFLDRFLKEMSRMPVVQRIME
jgi:hypothetical protein